MGLFHKIGVGLKRVFSSSSIDTISEEKSYGNDGEIEVEEELHSLIPNCIIKSNVMVYTSKGNCEIDLLVSYENKLFVIEVKHWLGRLYEQDGYFVKEKDDRWTGEVHEKELKSPFGQVKRQVYLLKEQTKSNPWINTIVFFADAEYVEAKDDNAWFTDIDDLADYIRNDGHTSRPQELKKCLDNLVVADFIYSPSIWGERSLHCIIKPESLIFNINGRKITKKDIARIDIDHHFSYDDIRIKLIDGKFLRTTLENHDIFVKEDDYISTYSFAKIKTILIGG